MEEEPFNPDYVDVDRVLEVSYCEDKDSGEVEWIPFHPFIASLSQSARARFIGALLFFFSFLQVFGSIFPTQVRVFVCLRVPKAVLMGSLAAFVGALQKKRKTEVCLARLLQEVVYYLVKWCSLPYEDSTWELKDDVDQSKIEEFEQLQAVKPDSRRVVSHVPLF